MDGRGTQDKKGTATGQKTEANTVGTPYPGAQDLWILLNVIPRLEGLTGSPGCDKKSLPITSERSIQTCTSDTARKI